MKELQYRKFSVRTHARSEFLQQPSNCQFELTFGCGLHCRHCYCDCYNKQESLKKELGTGNVKRLLDKIRKSGVIWLCFTGGDPLTRKDFSELYSYAKKKGFLISVFTSGYSLDKKTLQLFKDQPPFVMEMTLNAVEKSLYERISRVKGSFARVVKAIEALTAEKIPLKIKTLVTRDNLSHISQVRKFLALRGFDFFPDYHIFARLDGDIAPCTLRVSPKTVIVASDDEDKASSICAVPRKLKGTDNRVFWCALSVGQGFHIDPYGNLFLCPGIRRPAVNIVEKPLAPVFKKMLSQVRGEVFSPGAVCSDCRIRGWCLNCPGKTFPETGDRQAPLNYYCELTKQFLKR